MSFAKLQKYNCTIVVHSKVSTKHGNMTTAVVVYGYGVLVETDSVLGYLKV